MSPAAKSAPVVAELGRPETPEETAARLAENSRLYRARKTINNLWLSLIACLGILAVIFFAVPRNDAPREYAVDYAAVAADAQPVLSIPLAAPTLPEGWHANAAEIRSQDNIRSWYIGFLTPLGQYIGMTQATSANETWIADQLARSAASGTDTLAGVDWTIYDNTHSSRGDLGNVRYAMTTQSGATTFLLIGTADASEFDTLAASIASTVRAQPTGPNTGPLR